MLNKTAAVIQKAVARDAAVYSIAVKYALSQNNHIIKSHLKAGIQKTVS